MSMTAQHHDASDPQVLKKFAENVGNLTRLHYLYLLTIADIQGTNPKLWNSWRSTLLSDLYQNTSMYLHHGLDSPVEPRELIQEVKESALKSLAKQGYRREKCLSFWQELEEDYFLRHSDDEVVRQVSAIFGRASEEDVVVSIHQYSARGATEIFIYCNDRNYLFAHIVSTLSQARSDSGARKNHHFQKGACTRHIPGARRGSGTYQRQAPVYDRGKQARRNPAGPPTGFPSRSTINCPGKFVNCGCRSG